MDIRGTIPPVLIVETSLIILRRVVSIVTVLFALGSLVMLASLLQTVVAEIAAALAFSFSPVKCLMFVGIFFAQIFVSQRTGVRIIPALLCAVVASMVRCHLKLCELIEITDFHLQTMEIDFDPELNAAIDACCPREDS